MRNRLARLLVRLAARLAPAEGRDRFLREWEAELWHEARRTPGGSESAKLVRGALGSFADALTMKRIEDRRSNGRRTMGASFRGWSRETKLAVRGLRRAPLFSLVAVLTLALGIGGSVAIFTLLDRVVLDPLPYPESGRLVQLRNQVPGVGPDTEWHLATAQYVHYAEHAPSLEKLGSYRRFAINLETESGPRRIPAARVSATLLELLGAEAALGRSILPADDRPGASWVGVLSHELWSGDFGRDPDVVGRTVSLAGLPVEIVGVMEPGLTLPVEAGGRVDLWLPLQIDPSGPFQNNHVFPTIARLAPGADIEATRAELSRIQDDLPEVFPGVYSREFFRRYGFRPAVRPLKDAVVGDLAQHLWILLGAVGLVLLIACANVANLFLVRAEERQRELAIRTALGAGRAGVWRHLLAESLSVAAAGGALGLGVGFWGVSALVSLAPGTLPRLDDLGLEPAMVLFAAGLSAVVGLALAAVPYLRHGEGLLARSLAGSGRSTSAGWARQRLRSGMVVGQVALALTLTVGAGLLAESAGRLRAVDPGFRPEGAFAVELFPERDRYPTPGEQWAFYRQVLERVRALPGVSAVGLGSDIPLSGGYGCTVQGFQDRTVYDRLEEAGLTTCAGQTPVTPGYFRALGVPVLQGRVLERSDLDAPESGAVVVSRTFAERFWPGEEALGQGVAPSGRAEGPFYRVVGVVGDVPAESLDGEPAVAVYYPVTPIPGSGMQFWTGGMNLVIRTETDDPLALFPGVRRAVAEVDPTIPLAGAREMETTVTDSLGRVTFTTLLLEIAAAVALLLAAVGLYGVVSYVVSRRTREIGMRMALGARPGRVQRMIVGDSLRLTVLGLLLGTGLALVTSRILEGLLYGVEPTHPLAFLAGVAALAGVGLLAGWLPARRAARVDPSEALRAE